MLSARASSLSLRQQALSSAAISNSIPSLPEQSSHRDKRSKNFVLADMEGRDTRENRACASCIAKLAPNEVGQVNWHVSEDQGCRLCQVADIEPEAFTKPFCNFLYENPTIFHTVDYFKSKLDQLGFKEVSKQQSPPLHCAILTLLALYARLLG